MGIGSKPSKTTNLYGAKVDLYKLSPTKLSQTGWPSVTFVLAENLSKSSLRNPKGSSSVRLSNWANAKFGNVPGGRTLCSNIKKHKLTGDILREIAHSKNNRFLLQPYGIPFSIRHDLLRAVKGETTAPVVHSRSKYITIDGRKIRNSTVALAKYMHMKEFGNKDGDARKVNAEWASKFNPKTQHVDLATLNADQIADLVSKKLRRTYGNKNNRLKQLMTNIRRYNLNGKACADIALTKKGRAGKMNAFGVPKGLRKAFFKFCVESKPPTITLEKARRFAGKRSIKLPTGKKVRDSSVTIQRSLWRDSVGYKKVGNGWSIKGQESKDGWPSIELVEKKQMKDSKP